MAHDHQLYEFAEVILDLALSQKPDQMDDSFLLDGFERLDQGPLST